MKWLKYSIRSSTIVLSMVLASAAVSAGNGGKRGLPDKKVMEFDYFVNNWNVVGLKDYRRGARVMPDNRIMLAGSTAAVQVRFGNQLIPLSRRHNKLAMDGWMPIMVINANDGPVQYEFTYWATPLPSVKDWKKAYDWPTEGENFLVWVRYKATNTSKKPTEAKVQVKLDPAYRHPGGAEAPREPKVNKSLHGSYSLTKMLAAGQTVEGAARFAFVPIQDSASLDKENHALWLKRTVDYWRGMMNSIAHFEVPCRKATDAAMAAHVCQLIASDHGQMRGGEGFYDQFYLRDAANQLMALEEAGHIEMARNAIKYFLQRQRADGRFAGGGNQGGQFDANGQTQWMLWQFYKITGDRAFLAKVYPNMLRATRWTMKARRVEAKNSRYAGMLQRAPSDGEGLWGARARRVVGYDLWNLRGITCTADASRILGKDEAGELAGEVKAYRADIDAVSKKTGVSYFPPMWDGGGRHWGNTETLWPTPLFDRDDPRVIALVDHVRNDWGGGYVEGTILLPMRPWQKKTWALHPYMGSYTTMADLIRGRHEKVVEDFYWYLLHSTAAHAFPEGIFADKREAWWNTIPHVTGACNYVFMLRHMLIHEAGDDLHLLKAVPDWWLNEGQEIKVERAPTHFGEVNLVIRGKKDGIEVKFDQPKRSKPRKIVLHLPESRPLIGKLDGVEVVIRSSQKKRWDFPTVVAAYEEAYKPKPDSVSLTTGKPATCSTALVQYPAQMANDGCTKDANRFWGTDVRQLNDPTPWWQVDLEKPTNLGRIVIIGWYGDARTYGFTVETSLDGKKWKMAADMRENKEPSTAKGYTCKFKQRKVRYIKVTQTSCSANTGRHLVEVMAFEK